MWEVMRKTLIVARLLFEGLMSERFFLGGEGGCPQREFLSGGLTSRRFLSGDVFVQGF